MPEGVEQDLARQNLPKLQRLGHLDHGHAAPLRAGHGLQQHGDAHVFAPKHIVVKINQRRVGWFGGNRATPESQLRKTRDHFTALGRDAVKQTALVVGLKRLQRGIGHGDAQFGLLVIADHIELLANRLG